jgi:copper chaperone CopZ
MKFLILCFLLISSNIFADVKVKVNVPGMVCQMCVFGMKKNFSEVVVNKDKDVIVDLEKKTVIIHLKKKISEEEIKRRVNDAGYNAQLITWFD